MVDIRSNFKSLGLMYDIQRGLSKAQGIPVVGLAFSVVKCIVSIAQIIVGIAATIFLGLLACVFENNFLAKKCLTSLLHVGLGMMSLGYSLANICTLTVVGYQMEHSGIKPISIQYSNSVKYS